MSSGSGHQLVPTFVSGENQLESFCNHKTEQVKEEREVREVRAIDILRFHYLHYLHCPTTWYMPQCTREQLYKRILR